jgi:hypothetical protein
LPIPDRPLHASGAAKADGYFPVLNNYRYLTLSIGHFQHFVELVRIAFNIDVDGTCA